MARKKVSLRYVANDSARRSTLKKRRANLMKKASELATLCDVDACVVVYDRGASQPEVWPPSATDAARVLHRFRAMPELDQCKKMLNTESYLQQCVDKLREQLERARRGNHKRETELLLHDAIVAARGHGLAGLSAEELAVLGTTVKAHLEEVAGAMQRLQEREQRDPATALHLSSPSLVSPPVLYYTAGAGHRTMVNEQMLDRQSWLKSISGGDAGASTSGGLGDMLQLGTIWAEHPWADKQGAPSLPPPM